MNFKLGKCIQEHWFICVRGAFSEGVMNKEEEEAIIGDFAPVEMIECHEKAYRRSKADNSLTDSIIFTYAWHLIKSRYKQDIRRGIQLMGDLVKPGQDQRDHCYLIALGHYKLEEFEEARNCIDRVLQMEPNNHQAQKLKRLVTKKITRDGLIGLGVLGGAAAVGGVVAVGVLSLAAIAIAKAKSS